MRFLAFAAIAFVLSVASASADSSWVGQPVGAPNVPSSTGYPVYPGTPAILSQVVPWCATATGAGNHQAPCRPGEQFEYITGHKSTVTTVPSAAVAPGSAYSIPAYGAFADPASPSGISYLEGSIPLSDFATASSVDALQLEIDQSNAQMAQQQILLEHYAAQGIAQALAMAGTGDIDPDQKISLSLNWGEYGGQSAAAVGVAVRLAPNASFNAGASGIGASQYGVRAGFRVGW